MAEILLMAFRLLHHLHHSTATHKAVPGDLKQMRREADFPNNHAPSNQETNRTTELVVQ